MLERSECKEHGGSFPRGIFPSTDLLSFDTFDAELFAEIFTSHRFLYRYVYYDP